MIDSTWKAAFARTRGSGGRWCCTFCMSNSGLGMAVWYTINGVNLVSRVWESPFSDQSPIPREVRAVFAICARCQKIHSDDEIARLIPYNQRNACILSEKEKRGMTFHAVLRGLMIDA